MAQQLHSWSFILENESLRLLKKLYMNINNIICNTCFICSSQKWEANQMFFNRWMFKQTEMYMPWNTAQQ